ncbi:hypothetical protein M2266_001011 [Streptomyces sp. SPB162]|nr:hypothetical protein [Streptomyces sp. SPB162]
MPAAWDQPGGRGWARVSDGIVDDMQILTALEWALAALAGLCLVLCALITVDSAR